MFDLVVWLVSRNLGVYDQGNQYEIIPMLRLWETGVCVCLCTVCFLHADLPTGFSLSYDIF